MAIVFGTASTVLKRNESEHWIAQGRTLAVITTAVGLGIACLQARFGGAPWSGVLMTLVLGLFKLINPTTIASSTPSKSPQAGFSGLPLLVGLAMVGLMGLAVVAASCTGARQRGAAAIGAFIDCEAPDVAAALPDLVPIAKEALLGAISGDGHVDATKLKADMQGAKSDLGRCVLAAALAALATPAPKQPGAPAAAELEIDGPALRARFVQARSELGWAPVRLPGGAVL